MEPRYLESVVQDGRIFERRYGRDAHQIGVTLDVYERLEREHNELVDSYNEYQQLLIQHNLIKVPVPPEEQIQKLLEINEQQAAKTEEQIQKLLKAIEATNAQQTKANEQQASQITDLTQRVDEIAGSLHEYIKYPTDGGESDRQSGSRKGNRNDRGQFRKVG